MIIGYPNLVLLAALLSITVQEDTFYRCIGHARKILQAHLYESLMYATAKLLLPLKTMIYACIYIQINHLGAMRR